MFQVPLMEIFFMDKQVVNTTVNIFYQVLFIIHKDFYFPFRRSILFNLDLNFFTNGCTITTTTFDYHQPTNDSSGSNFGRKGYIVLVGGMFVLLWEVIFPMRMLSMT